MSELSSDNGGTYERVQVAWSGSAYTVTLRDEAQGLTSWFRCRNLIYYPDLRHYPNPAGFINYLIYNEAPLVPQYSVARGWLIFDSKNNIRARLEAWLAPLAPHVFHLDVLWYECFLNGYPALLARLTPLGPQGYTFYYLVVQAANRFVLPPKGRPVRVRLLAEDTPYPIAELGLQIVSDDRTDIWTFGSCIVHEAPTPYPVLPLGASPGICRVADLSRQPVWEGGPPLDSFR